MLIQRILTGVAVAATFLLALLALPSIYLSGISTTVLVFAAWEWAALSGVASNAGRATFTALVALALGAIWWALVGRGDVAESALTLFFSAGMLLWLVLLGVVLRYPAGSQFLHSVRIRLVLGAAVVGLGGAGFSFLSANPLGKFWIVYAVAIVVVADIGAYFAGKKFGKRKLAPRVSPAKSWEGFWGGFVAAQILAAVFYLWVWDIFNKLGAPPALEPSHTGSDVLEPAITNGSLDSASLILFISVAGLLSAASVLGDLFESVLKRNIGAKDSGNLLPGHGGILDRIDGMLASVPLLAFFVLVLHW